MGGEGNSLSLAEIRHVIETTFQQPYDQAKISALPEIHHVIRPLDSTAADNYKRQRLTSKESLFKEKALSFSEKDYIHVTLCMEATFWFHGFSGHCSVVCFIVLSA